MSFGNILAVADWAPDRGRQGPLFDGVRARTFPGADAEGVWASHAGDRVPAIHLSHSSIWTAPGDRQRLQPLASRSGDCRIIADARLDNRRELMASIECGADAERIDEISDADLILASYERWGTDAPQKLQGDFAFIIWDASRRMLFAARDIFGVRGLMYFPGASRLVLASTPNAVWAALGTRSSLNRGYLLEFLAGNAAKEPVPTAFSGLFWLAPAHRLTYVDRRLDTSRYDRLQPRGGMKCTEAGIYGGFREHLAKAVESRLAGVERVGFLVSGGFDSSSVLSLANGAVRNGGPLLRSYSATFAGDTRANETVFLDAVLGRCDNVTSSKIPWDEHMWTLDALGPFDGFDLEEPPEAGRWMLPVLARRAVADGCRVIQSGMWSDALVFRQPYNHGALLWTLPPRRIIQEWRHFAAQSWLGPIKGLVKRTQALVTRGRNRFGGVGESRSAVAAILESQFVYGGNAALMNHWDRVARYVGAEFRYPFLDRSLHEFVLSVPSRFLFHQGERKLLLRRGLADLLPPSFKTRSTFAAVTQLFVEGGRREVDKIRNFLGRSLVVDGGLVTRQRIASLEQELREGASASRVVEMQRILAVEYWLRIQATHGILL